MDCGPRLGYACCLGVPLQMKGTGSLSPGQPACMDLVHVHRSRGMAESYVHDECLSDVIPAAHAMSIVPCWL